MESVFQTHDCKYNPETGFWQSIQREDYKNLANSSDLKVFEGKLSLLRPNGSFKTRKFILTRTTLYYLSKSNLPKQKSNVN